MIVKKIAGMLFLCFAILPYAASAVEDKNVICNSCTDTTIKNNSITWGANNLKTGEVAFYTAIDLINDKYTSYEVKKSISQPPPGTQWRSSDIEAGSTKTTAVKKTAPLATRNASKDVIDSSNDLSYALQNQVGGIPPSVMKGAWDYMDCYYCKGSIEDYLESHGVLTNILNTMSDAINTLSIFKVTIPEMRQLDLSDGGRIKIKVTLMAGSGGLLIMSIDEITVYDQGNNQVPANSSSLHSGNMNVVSNEHNILINQNINPAGWGVPSGTGILPVGTGTLTCKSHSECTFTLDQM
ncbi:MAG: hypothetical protein CMI00_13850 [Oceanospirillaceae bacterium]|nr:hypothetical protein [Oceanospirillaceae bacterium]|tara:strand:- start:1660 stop:2547 length:888 start_codon:yes stop_codon:yes gene_type:complete